MCSAPQPPPQHRSLPLNLQQASQLPLFHLQRLTNALYLPLQVQSALRLEALAIRLRFGLRQRRRLAQQGVQLHFFGDGSGGSCVVVVVVVTLVVVAIYGGGVFLMFQTGGEGSFSVAGWWAVRAR